MFLPAGFILIFFTLLLITIDLIFIPTSILSITALLGLTTYIGYGYFEINTQEAVILTIGFIGVGSVYTWIIFKFKILNIVSHKSKLINENNLVYEIDHLIGQTGNTLTKLHPSGQVEINNKKYDAITKMGYIDINECIIVTGRSGSQIEVNLKE